MEKYNIAIVDDSPLVRMHLRMLLDDCNCTLVFEAKNGNDCLIKMQDCQIIPQLIISDIQMPLMDGYQTTTAIKKTWPLVKVLIFSAEDSQHAVLMAKALGADDFVSKLGDINNQLPKAIMTLLA